MKLTKLTINSTLAFTAAFLFTILLHETAHYVTALLLDSKALLFHNYVRAWLSDSPYDQVLFAGVAPLFSLILGIISLLVSKRIGPGATGLFCLWMGICGLCTFFGYLFVAPLLTFGDTGRVFQLLGVPFWVQLLLSVGAVIGLTIWLRRLAPSFNVFAPAPAARQTARANAQILFPLLTGVVLVGLLQFPLQNVASLLAVLAAPMSIFAVYGTLMGAKLSPAETVSTMLQDRVSRSLIFLFLLAVVINRLLAHGAG